MSLDSSHLAASTLPLFNELQTIWDEFGKENDARDDMLLQLEQECIRIYHEKVERIRNQKANLQQCLVKAEAEITQLAAALGEQSQYENIKEANLKQQKSMIELRLENLRLKKEERIREIIEIKDEVARISAEMTGDDQIVELIRADDLTAKKLEELKFRPSLFQNEKDQRLRKVDSYINAIRSLTNVMSLDFEEIMADIHPSLLDSAAGQPKSISNNTLALLSSKLNLLGAEKEKQLACGKKNSYTSASVKD